MNIAPTVSLLNNPRPIIWTQLRNDVNGNPRYVLHFLHLVTEKEYAELGIEAMYEAALRRARFLGGKRFHNKQYGGGIVFVCYNLRELEGMIHRCTANDNVTL